MSGLPSTPLPGEESLLRVTHLVYALHAFSALTGIFGAASVIGAFLVGWPSIIAVIINYVKRPDARGTIYESHMTWMIATFWWTLFWVVVSFIPSLVLSVVSFGLLSFLFVIPGLWFLYRMIKGVLRLIDGRPVP